MKSERRHELHENELAQELGKAGEFVKNNLKQLAAGFLILVLLLILGISFVKNQKLKTQGEWAQYISESQYKSDPAEAANILLELASKTSQDKLAALAYNAGGEKLMEELAAKWGDLTADDRDKQVLRAEAAFKKVLSDHAGNERNAAKAKLNLARLAELQGDYETAAELYGEAAEMPGAVGAIRTEAMARLAVAKNPPVAIEMAHKPAAEKTEDGPAGETAEPAAPDAAEDAAGTPAS